VTLDEEARPIPAVLTGQITLESLALHGETVAYQRIRGTGPTILLVHGVGASSTSWDTVLPLLAQQGADVIAVDLPGHGLSSKPRGDYSLGALASALRDLLDHLDVKSCVLVGHSLGGGIALQFVYQFPDRVDRLVLVSSGGLGPETFYLLRAATLPGAEFIIPVLTNRNATASFDFLRKSMARVGWRPEMLSEDTVMRLRELNERETRIAFLATLRAVVDHSGQRVSAVSRLPRAAHLPTLLIWGDSDPVIPLAHGQGAQKLLPKSELVVFTGATHEPHRFDPSRFTDLLVKFANASDDDDGITGTDDVSS
jgi:pimeloyl-ACP methyl ester carboxylesterase